METYQKYQIKPDHRNPGWEDELPRTKYGGATLTGNLVVPAKVFHEIGGLDENIIGHGAEDAELGFHLNKKGYSVIFSERIIGYHQAHTPVEKLLEDIIDKIRYIHKKHDIPLDESRLPKNDKE